MKVGISEDDLFRNPVKVVYLTDVKIEGKVIYEEQIETHYQVKVMKVEV